jgi:exonuclease VII large subunit
MTLPIISLILPHLFDIARTVVRDEIADRSAPIRSDAPAAAAERVAREIVQEVQRIPEVQHVTGSEPHWYQQRSKWSAIVSGILVVRRRSSPASGSPSARSCRR